MSTITYHNDLWIIGATLERRRAEAWLAKTGALDLAELGRITAVFHPTQGHEIASSLAFSTPNRSFYGDATTLATRFPSLTVVLAECDEDGEGAGWTVFHGGPISMDHPTRRFDHPSNDPDEVMNAQRLEWQPQALAIARTIPFPDGDPLEQATWRDDGNTVARLLQDSAHRPQQPELWWAGLGGAFRRQATWIDLSMTHGRYLDGRDQGWRRSAVDAWAEAFPDSLRDPQRWTDTWSNPDVSARVALARWVGADRILTLAPLDWPGATPTGSDPSLRPWPAVPGTDDPFRTLPMPWWTDEDNAPDAQEHLRLLHAMSPSARAGVLNAWLGRIGRTDPDVLNDATGARSIRTIEAWHAQHLLPPSWFDARTVDWLHGTPHAQLTAWVERHVLHTFVPSPTPEGPHGANGPPSRGSRARL